MPHPIPNIIDAVGNTAWAMHGPTLDRWVGLLNVRALGGEVPADVRQAALDAKAARPSRERSPDLLASGPVGNRLKAAGAGVEVVTDPACKPDENGVCRDSGDVGAELFTLITPPGAGRTAPGLAVVPVRGVLAARASMVNGVSQPTGMTYARAARGLLAACDHPRVANGGMVLLDCDSPGGTVSGGDTLVSAVRTARQRLGPGKVHAFAGDMACSGMYWPASACDSVVGPPAAVVGSVGVYTVMYDFSAVAKARGYRAVLIASGPDKGVGATEDLPLTDENVATVAREIRSMADAFLGHVAGARNLNADQLAEVGRGGAFVGADAVRAGLMDGVASFTDVVDAMLAELA